MADVIWVGDAPAVANVQTATIDAYDTATTYTVTINGKTISTVGTGGTVDTTATALRALLNAATAPPEFLEITWSGATSAIIGTADTAGKPFTATLTVAGGTGTVTDFSETTANSGPNACIAANFKNASTGARALPVDSDNLYFQDSDVDLKYNLDAITGVTPAATHIKASFTGQIGLPFYNTDGATNYQEYRERYLLLDGSTAITIGDGDGDGSDRLQLNLKAVQSAVTIYGSATAEEEDYHAIVIKGTHASNTLTIKGGTCDVAPFAAEVATFVTITATDDAELRLSGGLTHTTIIATGNAIVEVNAAATTITIHDAAEVTRKGAGAVTTANVISGTLFDWGSGTITTVNVGASGVVDNTDSPVSKIYTNTVVGGAAQILDTGHKVTFTNAINPGQGTMDDVTLALGNARTILPGAP